MGFLIVELKVAELAVQPDYKAPSAFGIVCRRPHLSTHFRSVPNHADARMSVGHYRLLRLKIATPTSAEANSTRLLGSGTRPTLLSDI